MDGLRREVIEELKRQGWGVSLSKNQHVKATSPSGDVVFTAGTGGKGSGIQNWISELRRKGFRWRKRRKKRDGASKAA